MSLLDKYVGKVSDMTVLGDTIRHPTHLRLYLACMDDVENRIGGFEHIILCYRGEEHDFTPEEVLAALYEQRRRMEVE